MTNILVPLLAAIIGGLCTALLSPWITSRLNERSRKLDLYKTVYPEKFKVATEVMERMSALYATIIRKRFTVDSDTLSGQVIEFKLMVNSYDWMLGEAFQKAAIKFYEISKRISNSTNEHSAKELEMELFNAGAELSRLIRIEVHLPEFESIFPASK